MASQSKYNCAPGDEFLPDMKLPQFAMPDATHEKQMSGARLAHGDLGHGHSVNQASLFGRLGNEKFVETMTDAPSQQMLYQWQQEAPRAGSFNVLAQARGVAEAAAGKDGCRGGAAGSSKSTRSQKL